MSGVLRTTSKRSYLQDWSGEPCDWVWLANWKASGLPYCSVYVIAPEGNWPSKIGIAVCARKRVGELQTSHWKRLVVTSCFWAPTIRDARAIERKSHDMLKEENVYLLGEWFDKKPDQAAAVVQFCAVSLGIELGEKIEDERVLEDLARFKREKYRKQMIEYHHMGTQTRLPVYDYYTTGREIT